jgi:magnesium chelatase accessory protein
MAHAAGAAAPVVALNPALMPFPGLAARIFPSLARLLFVNPLVPRMLAGMASLPGEPGRFLRQATGSTIDRPGLAAYGALLATARHCGGALEMMANWDLEAFHRRLPQIGAPVLLLHSDGDVTVPLASVEQAAAMLPDARLVVEPGLGHLAHEERPDWAVGHILAHARREQGGSTT